MNGLYSSNNNELSGISMNGLYSSNNNELLHRPFFFKKKCVFGRRAVCESAYLNFTLDKPDNDFATTNGHNCIVIRKLLNVK